MLETMKEERKRERKKKFLCLPMVPDRQGISGQRKLDMRYTCRRDGRGKEMSCL
jgi:hypothetical protein